VSGYKYFTPKWCKIYTRAAGQQQVGFRWLNRTAFKGWFLVDLGVK